LLTSKKDAKRIVLLELKNSLWDASDERLVRDAMFKAGENGYKYFVTGTPRELIIWETFKEGVPMQDRKYKSYIISTIRKDNEVLTPHYEKDITPRLLEFLKDLAAILHDQTTEIVWDSIDKYFVRKLSEYILQASESTYEVMLDRITKESRFQKRLSDYLKSQDMFNISVNFTPTDAYNICQLANYLLYLKIIFYTHLQRDAPALCLKPLVIPEKIEDLNDALRERFNDVLKHDFEKIFETTILDEFEFEATFIPELKRNVTEFETLDFAGLNADIIGSIYNTLIDNQEQHDRGQHFTNLNEVDIVNAFCINQKTRFVMDSGCGAGTFLVRAYFFLKQYNPKYSHQLTCFYILLLFSF
jgi:type I restriction-modification system DNA methylase subunit